MFDTTTFLAIVGTFLLAGMVKGVIGLGLPTISLGLLTALLGLPNAMALLLAPSFVTNVWQAALGGNALLLTKRLWPFFLLTTIAIWFGAKALSTVDVAYLSGLLGLLLILNAVTGLAGYRPTVPLKWELVLNPLIGATNGVLTGMTGSSVVPGVLYLQAIGLSRDQLVQAMGILFALSAFVLALSLYDQRILSQELSLQSIIAVLPALIGMRAGQHIRKKLSENQFRRFFFVALLLLGLFIIAKSFGLIG